MLGVLFVCFIAPPARVMSACVGFCARRESQVRLARRLPASMEARLCSGPVPVRSGFD